VKAQVRGNGRALVYLHPAGGVRWTPALEMLAQMHAVHMPTFPGFDGTALVENVNSRQALARLVGDYIHKEIGQACDVMGCSFGGAVALWLAIDHPQCVDHLVLECPAGLQTIDPALRANPHAFYKALFAHPENVSYERKPEELEAQNRSMLAHYGAQDGKDRELAQALGLIRATTLILHGTEDRVVSVDTMRILKSRLARAFLIYVWDAAHNIEVDQPARLAGLVQSFLERSDAFVVRYA
jgi:pimeloyl-ACP methyl ester carboxylesterase